MRPRPESRTRLLSVDVQHSDSYADRIQSGIHEGELLGVTGTPTVIINGWRLPRPPYDSLSAVINAIQHGDPPYNGSS